MYPLYSVRFPVYVGLGTEYRRVGGVICPLYSAQSPVYPELYVLTTVERVTSSVRCTAPIPLFIRNCMFLLL